jgi:FdhE protein
MAGVMPPAKRQGSAIALQCVCHSMEPCAGSLHHLRRIEGNDGAVQAETCDDCHSYAKMLHQAKHMVMDPMADDLASLWLNMLVDESGLQRASNPLAITDH